MTPEAPYDVLQSATLSGWSDAGGSLDQLTHQLGLGQLGAQLVDVPGLGPTALRQIICCPDPKCRQRVKVHAGALQLHWHGDGTQCPQVWPAYVAGAPTPKRRPRRPVTPCRTGGRRRG